MAILAREGSWYLPFAEQTACPWLSGALFNSARVFSGLRVPAAPQNVRWHKPRAPVSAFTGSERFLQIVVSICVCFLRGSAAFQA